jgi:hypothetical protein
VGGPSCDLRYQAVCRRQYDTRTLTVDNFHDAGALERLEGLPYGRSTDPIHLHEFPLRWQMRARWHFAGANACHESVEYVFVEFAALDDLGHDGMRRLLTMS